MNPRKTLLLAAGLIVLLVFSGWITYRAKRLDLAGGGASGDTSALMGKSAPDFTLRSLDGQQVKLSGYRGRKTVVVSFWASWCGPCRLEMPSLETFYQKNRDRDIELLAVSIDQNPRAAQQYTQENKLPFPVLLDEDSKTADSYNVEGIPTFFVVDKQGKVRFFHAGADAAADMLLTIAVEQAGAPASAQNAAGGGHTP